jgi:uncharacterized protein YaeQ
MAQKAIIHRAGVQVSNLDENLYMDHQLTIARHPSETDERMMLRIVALALNAKENVEGTPLEFTKDMFDPDEPCLWQRDYTERVRHWIDLGQPDEKRILRASGRADQVTVYSYGASGPPWWQGIADKVARASNLTVWQVQPAESEALASLADRSMDLNVTLQDGVIYVEGAGRTVELHLQRLQ